MKSTGQAEVETEKQAKQPTVGKKPKIILNTVNGILAGQFFYGKQSWLVLY